MEPIVRQKPPPAGYVRKSVEPNGGGELFETLLKTSTEIFKLVSIPYTHRSKDWFPIESPADRARNGRCRIKHASI